VIFSKIICKMHASVWRGSRLCWRTT